MNAISTRTNPDRGKPCPEASVSRSGARASLAFAERFIKENQTMFRERVATSRIRFRWARPIGLCLVAVLTLAATENVRAANPVSDLDRRAFLAAIAEVETGGNARAVGRNGERGLYQFRSIVWRQYTTRSFYDAHNPTLSYQVAVKHFEWLSEGFRRNGKEPTPYMLAAAWNSGLSRTLSGRLPASTRSYAQRVSNLVSVAEAPQVASIEPDRQLLLTR